MIQNVLLVGLKELDGKEWCQAENGMPLKGLQASE